MGHILTSGPLSAGLVAALSACSPALAQEGADVSGYVDVRASVADGQLTGLKGGYGKSRYDGDAEGEPVVTAEVAEAALIWHPRFSETVGAIVHAQYQPYADNAIDIVEAYLAMKTAPGSPLRLSGKAGIFFPQISLEHDEFGWTTYHTITPSAINTWIGEEIKALGVEATIRQEVGPGDLSFTASMFGFNDTSGTVLAFRGWALHDQEATVFGTMAIPVNAPKRKQIFSAQDDYSKSMLEVDERIGFYGQVRYDGDDGFSLSAYHYDNAGDRMALDGLQWGWETRFTNFGASFEPVPGLQVLSQYVTGETKSGWYMPQVVIDVEFSAFYVLGAWEMDGYEFAARYDEFRVDDQSFVARDNENEAGSAVTLAVGRQLVDQVMGRVEFMWIDSDRPQRIDAGLPARDEQTIIQSSLTFAF